MKLGRASEVGQHLRDWPPADADPLSMLGLKGAVHLEDSIAGSTFGTEQSQKKGILPAALGPGRYRLHR